MFLSCYAATFHGFVIWFDVAFDVGKGKDDTKSVITLSTAPEAEPTHWGQVDFNLIGICDLKVVWILDEIFQTLLLLDDSLDVMQDDTISGVMDFKQNEENKRHVDIILHYRHETFPLFLLMLVLPELMPKVSAGQRNLKAGRASSFNERDLVSYFHETLM